MLSDCFAELEFPIVGGNDLGSRQTSFLWVTVWVTFKSVSDAFRSREVARNVAAAFVYYTFASL